MDIEVGHADHVACICPAAIEGDGFVRNDKATPDILDPQVVGHPINQSLEREALVRDGARGLEFSYVLMCRDPSAALRRPMSNLNCPPVLELIDPGS